VDIIRRLHAAGVRVPTPLAFMDGVLVMECVTDAEGNPAPRLSELSFDPATAQAMFDGVIREVVRMLSIGVVHGDLSEFNVLIGRDGPVIIDFPQSVDTASNTNSRRLLLRDVDNFHRFLSRFVPNARRLPLAEEMWDLHENNALTADTRLTGRFRSQQRRSSGESVLDLIQDADRDERRRRDALGLRGGPQVQAQGSYQRGGGQGGGGYGQGGGQNQDRRPPHSGDRPQYSADRPQNQNSRPPYNGDRPQSQNSRPPYNGDRPQHSGPQNQDRRPPHNGDRPQYNADRPQNQDRRPPYGGERGPQANHGQRPPHPNGDGRRPQSSGRGRQGPRPGGNPQQGDQASRGGDGRRPEPKQPRMPEVIVVRTRRSTEPS
jgi:RIO kinase 1